MPFFGTAISRDTRNIASVRSRVYQTILPFIRDIDLRMEGHVTLELDFSINIRCHTSAFVLPQRMSTVDYEANILEASAIPGICLLNACIDNPAFCGTLSLRPDHRRQRIVFEVFTRPDPRLGLQQGALEDGSRNFLHQWVSRARSPTWPGSWPGRPSEPLSFASVIGPRAYAEDTSRYPPVEELDGQSDTTERPPREPVDSLLGSIELGDMTDQGDDVG